MAPPLEALSVTVAVGCDNAVVERARGRAAIGVGIGIVAAALVIVVLASRGVPGDRTAAAYSTSFDDRMLLAVFVVLVAAATALVIWSAWPDGAKRPETAPRSWWRQYAASLAVLLLFVLLGTARQQLLIDREQRRLAEARAAATRPDGDATEIDGTDRWLPKSGTLTVVLGATALALAAAFVGRRMAEQRAGTLAARQAVDDDRGDGDLGREAAEVLPDRFDEEDLVAEPDPRRAVRLAYALLERRLAGTTSARPVEATPQEWLAILRRGGPDGRTTAARRLTALYERARFAPEARPMTVQDRDEAIEALRVLTADLVPSTSTGGRGS